MPNLYPVFEPPALVEQQVQATGPKYGKAWAFDFEKGDFVLDGRGRPVVLDGHQAWVQWCIKAVLTQRLAYAIYSPAYGCELEEARQQPSRAAVEAALTRAITEALLADPRTEMVRGFQFSWAGDTVTVSFEVVPVIGSSERLEVTLGG